MTKSLGKRKLIRDISANTLQTGVTQVFGLVFFYLASRYLSKEDFGELNWSSALGATVIALGSLGLDLIFVKRIASGSNVLETTGIHFFHTLLSGVIICGVTCVLEQAYPKPFQQHPLLLFSLFYLAVNNIGNSFKLCLNGLESYKRLALIATIGNVLKLVLAVLLFFFEIFTAVNLLLCYAAAACLELVIGYLSVRQIASSAPKPILRPLAYKYFILESLPQLGVVLFDSALARIDWILLGIIGTGIGLSGASQTAEYSFTYKVFELSKLPLLVIAPILLTRFSRFFSDGKNLSENRHFEINELFKLEGFLLLLLPLFFISTWTPFIDFFTGGKYGAANENTFWILAFCVPLHGVINFLWTCGFVEGRIKSILWLTITVSLVNVICNVLLIPKYGGMGAAMAFLFSTLLQLFLYVRLSRHSKLKVNYWPFLMILIFALVAVGLSLTFAEGPILRTVISFVLYVGLCLLSGIINMKNVFKILRGQ